MNTNRFAIPAATLFGFVWISTAAALTEPPAVLYGKVLQHGDGASYQLFRGGMDVTLVNQADPEHRVVLRTALREVGEDGSFSYRLELPQKYLPSEQDLDDYLEVDRAPTSYSVESVTVDGESAVPLDAARANLTTAFALRAGQHRLDLRVSLPESDADSDGMPDWWEDYYGLNRNSATDASGDLDGDGLTNLEEFQGGTDPLVANTVPLLRTRLLVFSAGGTAGLALSIVDVDSEPDAIELTITTAPDGLAFFRGSTALPTGKPFTYADVLAGRITAEVDPAFGGGTLDLEVKDLGTGGIEAQQVAVEASSPWAGGGPRPTVWLNAGALNGGPVSEWGDMSGNGRDAFQPDADSQPVAGDGAVDFGGDAYLFLDMKGLVLGDLTAFAAFDLAKHQNDAQTLFRTSEVAMTVAGKKAGSRARSLLVDQPDRTAVGPVLPTGVLSQVSLVSDGARTFFNVDGSGHFPSAPADNSDLLPHAFATLGGAQQIVESAASALLDGSLREFVLFDHALTPAQRTRNEDYQRSRYGDIVVWDYRAETAPIAITGRHSSQNAINGGWGGDQLTGGPLDDILRGGSGDDVLEGGDGGDWFAFTKDEGGADTVVDFSIEGGDVIDLSDIFGGQEGDPAAYVYLRSEIELSPNEQPVVNTVLELNYDGEGEAVDQTVTLAGVALSNTGLVKLLASGSLVLGGPLYQTTVMLAAEETTFPAVPAPHEVMVSRSGETDSEAIEVPLTFGGSADIGVDFVVDGVVGEGPVRMVEFSPGETMKRFSVTPVAQPGVTGSKTIVVDVLEGPAFVNGSPLTLTMTDAPTLMVATTSHASTDDGTAGVVRFTRTGALDQSLTLQLTLDGSAENGTDYERVSDTLTIGAGSAGAEIRFVPAQPSGARSEYLVANVHIEPAPDDLVMIGSGSASVVLFDDASRGTGSFAEWKEDNFPGIDDPGLGGKDADGDGITNLWEYIYGTNPHVRTPLREIDAEVRIAGDGHLEVGLRSVAGFTDVQLEAEGSNDLTAWLRADDLELVLRPIPGDTSHVRRIYRSIEPVRGNASAIARRLFRLQAYELPVEEPGGSD